MILYNYYDRPMVGGALTTIKHVCGSGRVVQQSVSAHHEAIRSGQLRRLSPAHWRAAEQPGTWEAEDR